MKKRKSKNLILKSAFPSLVSLAIASIFLIYIWLAKSFVSPRLPDSSHPIQLYSTDTKDDLSLHYMAAIHAAKKEIILIIYALNDPKIIKALKQKSQKGVDVTVIYDPKASKNIEKRLGPKVKVVKRFGKGLMHQKILIIDDRETWIGSANMTGESLRHHGNLVIAIENKQIAEYAKTKAKEYIEEQQTIRNPHLKVNIGSQQLELWFLPDDPAASLRLKQLIRGARKTIRVAMFTWTRHDLAKTIIEAKNRGVDTKVVIDNSAGNGAGAKVVEQLEKGGVAVKLSQGQALLHHKFLYIDENILVNGSANWTKAAFNKNDDCFIVLNNLTEEQKDFMNKAWDVIY